MDNIYKYVGHDYLEKVIGDDEKVTLKCTYPRDFNDPYELFLTVDFKNDPDVLAFYADAIGKISQLPTACFSLLPTVIPMWAHYARNHQGFTIEFNEKKLSSFFPDSVFGNVDYRNAPKDGLNEMLHRASAIGKPRYLYLLNQWVFSAAYFTKTSCWSYEHERRMVLGQNETRQVGDLMLVDVPTECITAFICGPRANADTLHAVRNKATQIGCNYYELRIGKSSVDPYFADMNGHPFIFNGDKIVRASLFCKSCKEPLIVESEQCSLCRIGDSHRVDAASRNVYSVLAHHGLLDEYISGMDDINRGRT